MPRPQLPDPRNEDIVVWVGNGLRPRSEAKVSVFDSSVQGGDAVWEGLRVYAGRILHLDAHLDRLFASAHAMAFQSVPPRQTVTEAIFKTLQANGMRDGVHVRLTLTRGMKVTSGMSPRFNQYGPCLIVLPEWKAPVYDHDGIRLISSSIRRNPPQCVDSKIHHTNLINSILAKIQADSAGVDDAIMLDLNGFVSETNATNLFLIIRDGLHTPHPDSCLPGITRQAVIDLAATNGLPVYERNVSLAEVYTAREAFTTGTMGELAPVLEVDARRIGNGEVGPHTRKLQVLYQELTATGGTALPDFPPHGFEAP